jgi:hypothetical protein
MVRPHLPLARARIDFCEEQKSMPALSSPAREEAEDR